MRILMTTDTLGGVFSYSVDLIQALRARGVEIVLVTLGRALSTAQRAQLAAIPALEYHETGWALEWMEDPWRDLQASGEWLLELAHRVQPDCVHLNQFAYGALTWPAPVLVVGHSCVASWWQAVHGERAPARLAHYLSVVQRGLRGAGMVVAPSLAMLASLDELYGPFEHARVIPNGIDLSAYRALAKAPRVLTAGRLWDRAKNLEVLHSIAGGSAWPIYVIGETQPSAVGSHDYAPCVAVGSLSRAALATELAHAAIYAAPARYEPFGLSVLEAAASGCALLLGRIPSLVENWQGAACFVDPASPAELARGLNMLISHPSYRQQLAHRAQKRAQGFAADRMASQYADAYTSLIADYRGGARCAS